MEVLAKLVVGSPVYWASPSDPIIEFMDKFCSQTGKFMLHKPGAAGVEVPVEEEKIKTNFIR